jgi:Alpha-2,8-polysialyltransferase (POLYST)
VTTIVLASTLYGLATATTILDNEPPAKDGRRQLVMTNNATMAEIVPDLDELDGFDAFADRFDSVLSLNALIAPYHPSDWRPGRDDLAVLRRLVRDTWRIGDEPVHLMVESIQVRPAQTVAELFPDAPITIYADGLMSYGPTRNSLSPDIFGRIERLVVPDLVPGLEPLLLGEYGVKAETFPLELLDRTLREMGSRALPAAKMPTSGGRAAALIIGQYLGELGLLSTTGEQDLHVRMLAAARRLGATSVLFKPHPSSPPALLSPIRKWADEHGLGFEVITSRAPVETMLDRIKPLLIVSAFSTALVMAKRLFGVPCVSVGADELLASLRPYENSNRIPLLIVAEMVPDGETVNPADLATWTPPDVDKLGELVQAVGYLMQYQRRADLRPAAEAVLAREGRAAVHVTRARLTRLGLPGGYPGGPSVGWAADTTVGRVARRGLRTIRRQGLANALAALKR